MTDKKFYEWKCEVCDREFTSLWATQLEQWKQAHRATHDPKKQNEVSENE